MKLLFYINWNESWNEFEELESETFAEGAVRLIIEERVELKFEDFLLDWFL